MEKRGNTDGPDRPQDDPEYAEYAEINPAPDLTEEAFMSADLNGPASDYEGWNGVDNVPPEEYGDLLDE